MVFYYFEFYLYISLQSFCFHISLISQSANKFGFSIRYDHSEAYRFLCDHRAEALVRLQTSSFLSVEVHYSCERERCFSKKFRIGNLEQHVI